MQFSDALIARLRVARRVAVLTGAGVSAESGIPTFRAAQTGLWARYDPQELATAEAFRRNPRLVWEWYAWRRQIIAACRPNPAHLALAALESAGPHVTLITQNIDGLHQEAGSRAVIELHGNIRRVKCFAHNHPAGDWPVEAAEPPRCPRCGSLLRPDVVWFGETLDARAVQAAVSAVAQCDAFFSIGTSTVVYPAAQLPWLALQGGALCVEINPEDTPFTAEAAVALRSPAGVALPALVKAVWGIGEG